MDGDGPFGASAGNALGADSGSAVGDGVTRWPVPTWKLGIRMSDDRGDI